MQKINAAKIPAVNVTDRSSGGDFVAFVGADDYTIAKETGEALLKAIGGKGDVIILEGVRGDGDRAGPSARLQGRDRGVPRRQARRFPARATISVCRRCR